MFKLKKNPGVYYTKRTVHVLNLVDLYICITIIVSIILQDIKTHDKQQQQQQRITRYVHSYLFSVFYYFKIPENRCTFKLYNNNDLFR